MMPAGKGVPQILLRLLLLVQVWGFEPGTTTHRSALKINSSFNAV